MNTSLSAWHRVATAQLHIYRVKEINIGIHDHFMLIFLTDPHCRKNSICLLPCFFFQIWITNDIFPNSLPGGTANNQNVDLKNKPPFLNCSIVE